VTEFGREYFERQYHSYESQNPARKLAFYRGLVERSVAGRQNPRVLDYGCAFGLFLGSLDPAWRRSGIDASAWAIQTARDRLPGVALHCVAPDRYPDREPHDAITAFDVLEHVPSLDDCLAWIDRSLVNGGGFVFVVPVYDGPMGPLTRLLDRDPTHVHRESRSFWLHKVGELFEIVDWWGVLRHLLPGGLYFHAVTHRFRNWTPAIACLARRPE
jgi:SAM-dependent methyltransferase